MSGWVNELKSEIKQINGMNEINVKNETNEKERRQRCLGLYKGAGKNIVKFYWAGRKMEIKQKTKKEVMMSYESKAAALRVKAAKLKLQAEAYRRRGNELAARRLELEAAKLETMAARLERR